MNEAETNILFEHTRRLRGRTGNGKTPSGGGRPKQATVETEDEDKEEGITYEEVD